MSDQPDLTNTDTVDTATDVDTTTVLTGAEVNDDTTESDAAADVNADAAADDVTEGDDADSGDAGEDQTSPESYADFNLPEGIELDSALMEQATPLFKELNLNQEQAQKLVDFQVEQVQARQTEQAEAFDQLKGDWIDQSKSDPDFGGDDFEKNVGIARAAMTKFGTDGLTKLMDDYGVGNHPEVIRFMVKVGKLTQEDVPGAAAASTSPEATRVSQLYPNG